MSWCLEQQREVVRMVLEACKELSNSNPVAALNLLLFASDRLPKLILIALGSLRCSDLAKAREDLEAYAVKMLRKALRTISKEVCSLDAARIVDKFGLSGENRSFVERSLSNASARARTSMQRRLSELYEELERRVEELRASIARLEGEELVARGLQIASSRAIEVLEKGFLNKVEVSRVVEVASDALSNEIEKACRRIAPRLGLTTAEVKSALIDWAEVKERVSRAVEKASELLKSFVASTLIMYASHRVATYVLTPVQQGQAIDPRKVRIEGIKESSEVLLRCLSLVKHYA